MEGGRLHDVKNFGGIFMLDFLQETNRSISSSILGHPGSIVEWIRSIGIFRIERENREDEEGNGGRFALERRGESRSVVGA